MMPHASSSSTSPATPTHSKALRVCVWVARLLVGGTFLFSGLMKAIDPMGTAVKIGDYFTAWGLAIGEVPALLLSCLLCAGEWLLGFSLLAGTLRRLTAYAAALTMAGMTLFTLYIWLANPVSDCGCFGDAVKLRNVTTFAKNLVLLPPALLLLRYWRLLVPLLPRKGGGVSLVVAGGLIAHFLWSAVTYLPVIDWRPYRVGSSIAELKELSPTSTADEDLSGYRFIYSKGGEERTFTMETLAEADSTWTYVRTEEPALAPVAAQATDFILTAPDGTDLTLPLATSEGRALIFVAADSSELSRHAALVARLDTLASVHHTPLIIATSSHDSYAYIDATARKTIVRAHPALLVVVDGILIRKQSLSSLKHDEGLWLAPLNTELARQSLSRHRILRWLPLLLGALVWLAAIPLSHRRKS